MSDPVLICERVVMRFPQGTQTLEVLKGVECTAARGESLAIVGPSGAGKSTLLHIAGGLLRPSAGRVRLDGVWLEGAGDAELAQVRNRRVGFVFQMHHLLSEFTALENVGLPARLAGEDASRVRTRARDLLDRVGLSARADHRPGELSGGEQQRVAIARALINQPAVLLADEPTGDLDRGTAEGIHDLLAGLRRDRNLTLVMVTHNPDLSRLADRIITLRDGQVQ